MKFFNSVKRLGEGFQISIGTNSIVSSFPFYEKLGFIKVEKNAESYNWLLLTDGLIKLLLHQDVFTGLGYFADDMDARANEMKLNGFRFIPYKLKLNQFYEVFKDKNNLLVSIIKQNVDEMHKPVGKSHSNCGKFKQISIITEAVESSVDYWTSLGFEIIEQNNSEKRFTILEDGLIRLGFYAPGALNLSFNDNAFTYCSKTINQKIINLKKSGINFTEEIKDTSGKITDAIAVSPEGKTFLFTSSIE
ncbi:MAG: hypothetical protein ABI550_07165 [Ignavibacteriaceae bacterium]